MKTKLLALGALFASLCISAQAQVDKTPVLHLSFDKVSGTTTGSVVTNDGTGGSAMNGTVNVGANGTLAFVPGKFGNALSVNGTQASDASVRIANAVVPLNVGAGQPPWSLAMWFQTTTVGGCFAYQGSGAWAAGNTAFYLTSGRNGGGTSGTHAGAVRNSQEWQEGTTDVNDGLWHHFVLTFDGTTKVMYLDGRVEPFDENSWPGNGVGNQFWIGGNPYNGDGTVCLNGLIDEVYVFNQALNTNDVQGLYSANTLPVVPVAVTVNPASGYRGQVLTLSATVSPGAGTVTNVTANLSAINLSATANLVLSSANVYTNSFTVPATAPVGARSLTATARTTTYPFVGSGGAAFTVLARPPTNAIIVTQISNVSAFEYTEASFRFATTNDAPNDAPFPMAYSWFTNGVLVSSNMGPFYTFLTTPADSGMQAYAIARVADTNFSSLAVTSAVATLTVNPGSIVYSNGLKQEVFAGATRADVEIGNVAPGVVSLVSSADSPGGFGNNHSRRYSGYFIPPSNDSYVFFVASDDDCDLFLSTDTSPANKRLIAQENGWSGTRNWQTPGGGGSVASQKRSDQWTNSVGVTPYAAGIPLVAGQKYYLESVMHNGGGGDNWAITYQTTNELALDLSLPLDGSASRMTASNNNIALVTWPGTNIVWALQPVATTVFEGNTAIFTAKATSDSEMTVAYQWYVNNAPTGGDTASLSLPLVSLSLNGAQIKVVASTREGGLSITATTTLTVVAGVFAPGTVLVERWNNSDVSGVTRQMVENGTAPPPSTNWFAPAMDIPNTNPDVNNFVQRVSGFLVPPATDDYVFFLATDDDGDLFLSTDDKPANKVWIAQVSNWTTGQRNWQGPAGGSVASQMRSDQFINPTTSVQPYPAGVHLVANTRYYIEMVHHEGTGGDYAGATFKLINDVDPANGTATRLTGSAVGVLTPPATVLNVTELPTNVTATALQPAYFRIAATNDNGIPITYQWRRSNGSGAMTNIPGATAQWYGLVASASDNGAVFDCVASQPGQPALNKTNSATLTVNAGTFTPGLINYERWSNQPNNAGALTTIQSGQSGPANVVVTTTNAYNIGDVADNYAQRLTGVFIAPSNGNYVFFVSGNDDADVFLNPTGDQPAGKVQIAEQLGSADSRYQWQEDDTPGDALQQRSDTYTNALGVAPYPTGIPLTGGNRYYLEAVHRAGGGDSYLGVTFAPYSADSSTVPTNGTPSVLTGNHIGYYSAPSKPVITMTRNGSNLNISWSPAGGALKSSPNVGAAMNTWTTLSTTNPATIPIGTGDLFMRVEQ